jgi:sugar lactone lactonase YvrE
MTTAKVLFQPDREELRFLPECPRAMRNLSQGGQMLGWVAIAHGADRKDGSFNLLDLESGENRSFPLPGRPGFFAETDKPGVIVVGLERHLALFDLEQGKLEETGIVVTLDERVVINDGIPVPGGLIFGTKDLAFHDPIASLYYFDSGLSHLSTIMGGQFCSNGKCFHADGDEWVLVDVDSQPRTITEYRLTKAMDAIVSRRLITPPAALPATPDGFRVAPGAESIVVTFYNPAAVSDGVAQEIRLSDGAVLQEWTLPGSPRVTCPEFLSMGGKVKLVFTTAVEGMPSEIRDIAPEAGSLFVADTAFTAIPPGLPLVSYDSLRIRP